MPVVHHAAGRVRVTSAGSTPAEEINPAVRTVMAELDTDLADAIPTELITDVVHVADVVITMGCGDIYLVLPGKATWTGRFPTPPACQPSRPN